MVLMTNAGSGLGLAPPGASKKPPAIVVGAARTFHVPPTAAIASGLDQAETLRDVGGAIDWPHPDPDPEYFLTVLDAMPGAIRPHVVRQERPGRDPLVIVARLEEIELETRVGYRTVLRPRLRCLTVVNGGVSGVETAEDGAAALALLRAALAENEADLLRFFGLATDSPLFAAATGIPSWLCRDHGTVPRPHWRVAVPGSLADFLAERSRNTRQNVNRYAKRFEKEYGDRLALRRYGAGLDEDVERLLADLETIAAKSYQRGLGVGFTGDELQRKLIELDLRRGRYLAWVLDLDGTPSAFWDGIVHGGTFFIGSPGYDPAFANHRIGTWLQMRMMEDLCAREDVQALDYGAGDAQYKRSYGDECWMDAEVHVFAATPKGLRANAARTAVNGAVRAARRALAGTGAEDRIKRVWRGRLQTGAGADQ
jgi:CelD/BcsL family acetyltransferase involved in cellulose biosynthesis